MYSNDAALDWREEGTWEEEEVWLEQDPKAIRETREWSLESSKPSTQLQMAANTTHTIPAVVRFKNRRRPPSAIPVRFEITFILDYWIRLLRLRLRLGFSPLPAFISPFGIGKIKQTQYSDSIRFSSANAECLITQFVFSLAIQTLTSY